MTLLYVTPLIWESGINFVNYEQTFTKRSSDMYMKQKLYATYHDPSLGGSTGASFTRSIMG